MKNNWYNNIKDKVKNCNYNFAKNILYHLIAPCVIILVGLILLLTVNFNLSYDYSGGSVASVVVVDKDLNKSNEYNNAKKNVVEVFNDNNVTHLVFQKVETNYYGDAIVVQFDRVSDDVREQLKSDLLAKFYQDADGNYTIDEDERNNYVKVDNFERSVSSEVLNATILAVLVTFIALFVYTASRKGLCAGFVSLFANVVSCLMYTGLLLITRTEVDINVVGTCGFIVVLSGLCSHMYFTRIKENLSKEIYAKTPKHELANLTTKQNLKVYAVISMVALIFALFTTVMPIYSMQSLGLAIFFALISSMYTSVMITPGLWAMFFVPKKKKQQVEKSKDVVVEEKLTEDDINNAPEIIVETEAKE